ncbi:ABC transporter substrate-binding protein [Caldalkalibacillus horti]|uniref:Peptide/nickel transport system substrate-binding protein n=1 Tax=Caldalkalibacillus horti TaxID=77523 RepID=A0ABT9W182_9BACI|nr:ABC transporter substrate-binding protein [Bacillus horti]MDQ0166817.1 peptide/nickel transport system substrate-binding protein [Bacillus horti]
MNIIKKSGWIVLTLFFVLVLAACGSNASTDSNDTENTPSTSESVNGNENTELEYKDDLNIALTAQPPTLDTPITVSAVALDTAGNIFEQLFTLNADYEPVPVLAESVEISDDGLTYTFPLRQGVKFHNGKEMVAEDVVASMNRWLVNSSRAKTLLPNANFEEIDPYTVKLTVEDATSDVLILLSAQAQFGSIVPKEIIDSASAEGITEYIGTGPYKFEEWRQDQYIHLVRFDEYHNSLQNDPSGFDGRKEAPTENLYFHFVTDHSTRIAGIKTGQYDVADSIPLENYDELVADNNLDVQSFPGGALTAFFNTSEGLLADVNIRQAILAAFNNEEIMLASFTKPDLYTLHPGYLNQNQVQWSNEAGAEYYNQADPDKAKALLDEAGYNGEEITLLTTRDYNEMYTATLVIQEQLRQIGMNVKVENYDFPTFLETKNDTSKWDIFVASTGYQLTPPQLLAVNPDWAGLDNETVKQALIEIRSASTPEQAKAEWEKLQGFMYEHASSTVIGHYNGVVAINKDLEGFELYEAPVVWNAKLPK